MNAAGVARVREATALLAQLGMPRAQQNARSALCLLAVLDLPPDRPWAEARSRLIGITPIMTWVKEHYGVEYAPNTRETFRRQTMHQFVQAGLVNYNPDKPDRAVNSPAAVYQAAERLVEVARYFGTGILEEKVAGFVAEMGSLAQRYARERRDQMVRVAVAGLDLELSPGRHSQLIREIVTGFASCFLRRPVVLYVGDTGDKLAYFDKDLMESLGVSIDKHGKMPDVVLLDSERNWLFLVEAVTSHGPVDPKRHEELSQLFGSSAAGIVYVTAFLDRRDLARRLPEIAWETEVWVAEAPTHLVHFNGDRFLGPYGS